jgi:hypothetical protein
MQKLLNRLNIFFQYILYNELIDKNRKSKIVVQKQQVEKVVAYVQMLAQ